VSPQPPFAKGDRLSRSVRGNSDRLGRRHKLLVGGQPTISCTPGKTVRDGKECGSRTQQLLLKTIVEIEPHNLRFNTPLCCFAQTILFYRTDLHCFSYVGETIMVRIAWQSHFSFILLNSSVQSLFTGTITPSIFELTFTNLFWIGALCVSMPKIRPRD